MLFPERMLSVNVLVLDEDSAAVTRVLAAEASFHVVDQRTAPVSAEVVGAGPDGPLVHDCAKEAGRAAALLRQLGVSDAVPAPEDTDGILSQDSTELVAAARSGLDGVHEAVDGLLSRRHDTEAKIARLDAVSEGLHVLDDCGLSLSDLGEMRRLFVAFGVLPGGSVDSLTSRLEGEAYHLERRPRGGDLSILLVGDRDAGATFEQALSDAGFRHHKIPERFHLSLEEGLDVVEEELWTLRDELAEVNGEFRAKQEGWRRELGYWARALAIHGALLAAMKQFGAVGHATVISGFVPVSRYGRTLDCLEKVTPGRYYAESFPADETAGPPVPTSLSNWGPFKPFELFVKNYGLPRYNDIDPTPFVAVSFLLMFGMMFGDVGHGAVLACIGACIAFLPYRAFEAMRSLGKILLMAGLSGVVFGFLFGSIFGIERDSTLPAIWMRPSHGENLILFLGASLVAGVGVLSCGIILSIVQSLRRGDRVHAWVGQWSFSSLLFYWMLLGCLGLFAAGKQTSVSPVVIACCLAVPLVIIVVGQLLAHRLGRGRHQGGELEPATLLFEPVEIVMNLFTNSISFLRVAAFGLAHAALTMTTYVIRDMIPVPGSDVMMLPFEHLFIIVLEGMIVTIQCLRLEYYEFFAKFFNGDGAAYSPLSAKRM